VVFPFFPNRGTSQERALSKFGKGPTRRTHRSRVSVFLHPLPPFSLLFARSSLRYLIIKKLQTMSPPPYRHSPWLYSVPPNALRPHPFLATSPNESLSLLPTQGFQNTPLRSFSWSTLPTSPRSLQDLVSYGGPPPCPTKFFSPVEWSLPFCSEKSDASEEDLALSPLIPPHKRVSRCAHLFFFLLESYRSIIFSAASPTPRIFQVTT